MTTAHWLMMRPLFHREFHLDAVSLAAVVPMVDSVVLMVDSVVDAGVVNEVVAAGVVHDMPSAGMAVPQMVDLHFGSHQLKVSMKIVLVFS